MILFITLLSEQAAWSVIPEVQCVPCVCNSYTSRCHLCLHTYSEYILDVTPNTLALTFDLLATACS